MTAHFPALPRRFKVAYIQAEDLLNCLELNASVPGDTLVKVSLGGVPPGTRVVGRKYDAARYAESLLLYHESWPEVPLSQQVLDEIEVTRTFVAVLGSVPRGEEETGHPMERSETEDSGEVTARFLDDHGSTIRESTTRYVKENRDGGGISVRMGTFEESTPALKEMAPSEITDSGAVNVRVLGKQGAAIRESTASDIEVIRDMGGILGRKVTFDEAISVRSGETLLITEMVPVRPRRLAHNGPPGNALEGPESIPAHEICGRVNATTVPADFLPACLVDEHGATVGKVSGPYVIRSHEVPSAAEAGWRDRPPLL